MSVRSPTPVYFMSLQLENIRCFGAQQRLDLTDANGAPARWTLMLGDNGVGKTTLLQCLVWSRPVPERPEEETESHSAPKTTIPVDEPLLEEENDYLQALLYKVSATELTLEADLSIGRELAGVDATVLDSPTPPRQVHTGVRIPFKGRELQAPEHRSGAEKATDVDGEFLDPFIVAYGANRQRGQQNLDDEALEDAVATSRLSDLTVMYDVGELLSKLDYAASTKATSSDKRLLEQFKLIVTKILPGDLTPADLAILPPNPLETGEPSGVHIRTFSGLVPISDLSLGYQTTLAWTTDLAWRLLQHYPDSDNPIAEPAIVLIDEIDLHLHPLWQLRILDDLTELFPRTQFIATAHSPLMVQVAAGANIVLLRKRETDVEIVNEPGVVRSWRVDQILTSELFDVPRARDKQTELMFKRRAELVNKPSRSAAEETELAELRSRIATLPSAQDPEDQRALELVREAAALLKKHKVPLL